MCTNSFWKGEICLLLMAVACFSSMAGWDNVTTHIYNGNGPTMGVLFYFETPLSRGDTTHGCVTTPPYTAVWLKVGVQQVGEVSFYVFPNYVYCTVEGQIFKWCVYSGGNFESLKMKSKNQEKVITTRVCFFMIVVNKHVERWNVCNVCPAWANEVS